MVRDTYDVGIVRCGSTGRAHARAYRDHARTEVVAVAELTESAREEFLADFDVPSGYEMHIDMLSVEDLDMVSVCTLHSTHAEISIDAAEADVDGSVVKSRWPPAWARHGTCSRPSSETTRNSRPVTNDDSIPYTRKHGR